MSKATLQVIEALRSGKTTLEALQSDLGIKVTYHPTLPLIILNYDQIKSPKKHPIVRECRSLCLEKGTWNLVARSFERFFNWGELPEEQDEFNFDNFRVQSKEDGSLVTLYYYQGSWHANTRGSFGLRRIHHGIPYTWRELVCKALGMDDLSDLNGMTGVTPGMSLVCELASPYNKVVRPYADTSLYLLTAYGPDGVELDSATTDKLAKETGASRPTNYPFQSIDEIKAYLMEQSEADPTFEGVVICDNASRRWKIKNPAYLELHRVGAGRVPKTSPKFLLPFVLKGEGSELLTYFPDCQEAFHEIANKVEKELHDLLSVWENSKAIKSQKDFAQAILPQTKTKKGMASILFQVRKDNGGEEEVKKLFRESGDAVLENLYGKL